MTAARSIVLGVVAAALGASLGGTNSHAAQRRPTPIVAITPYRASGIYAVGETVGWTLTPVAALIDGHATCTYELRRNNMSIVKRGSLDFSQGKATVETVGDQPEMLYLAVQTSNPADGGRPRMASAGAAVAPTKLTPSAPRPRDFDRFWREKIADLEKIPMNPVLTAEDSGMLDVDYATIRMDHINGTHVYGQLAKPSQSGRFPALLILQWASPPYPLQKSWVTSQAAKGWLTLNIEPHDVLPTAPQSYYDALPASLKNYQAIGRDNRDECYFLQMYLADYRAVDYLASRPDWDGKTLVVMGGSMGGQQSLCVAGLHPKITHVIVEEPSGCDTNGPLHGRAAGYPYFPPNDPKAMETALYFDAVNFAPRIRAKSLVAMGFVDTIAPPVGIWTAFNEIRGPKEAAPMVDAPHNNIATYRQQLPYYTRMNAWLDALVRGKPALVGG